MENHLKDIYMTPLPHKVHGLYRRKGGKIVVADCSKTDFIDKIRPLHIYVHSDCDCIQKTSYKQSNKILMWIEKELTKIQPHLESY